MIDPTRTPSTWVRRVWAAIGWMMVVSVNVLSLTPSPLPELGLSHLDKAVHAISYAVLMLWFVQLYGRRRWFLIATAFIGMGMALEVFQGQTTYRSFSYGDMVANTVGVLAAWRLALAGFCTGLLRLEQRVYKQTPWIRTEARPR